MSSLAPSELKIDLSAYADNIRALKASLAESCRFLAVVKADGYGLGAVPLARRAVVSGVSMLGVATVEEGVALREADITIPILVLVQPSHNSLDEAVAHDLRLTVSDVETAEAIGVAAGKAKRVGIVHCKIDTGMGRQGFPLERAVRGVLAITRLSSVDIEGLYTHLSSADMDNDTYTEEQIRTFRQLRKEMAGEGIPYEMVHAANSAALLSYPSSHFDMVRAGLATYGIDPLQTPQKAIELMPVAEWTSSIVLLKEFAGGAAIGYGRTFRTPSPMQGAVVPVGYADGYLRSLSNRAEVLVGGVRCPVVGAVSMDQIVVDVSKVDHVAIGDKVTLIGRQMNEEITAGELAAQGQTIPYEIMARIGPRVRRVYVG